MTIVIFTPIQVEYDAVQKHLHSFEEKIINSTAYGFGKFQNKSGELNVILQKTGSKIHNIARASERAVNDFRPDIALLVGVAGGVKDVRIGDIVIGTKAYGYSGGKETDQGFKIRPQSVTFSKRLVVLAEKIGRNKQWLKRLVTLPQKKINVVSGPIASGDKVIASTKSDSFKIINNYYNDTIAIEMEAIGFASTMLFHPQVEFANLRAISDLLKDKSNSDQAGGQEMAAARVAAFSMELVHQLELPINLRNTNNFDDLKVLSKKIFDYVFPIVFGEKTISRNPSIVVLIDKVMPLISHIYEEIQQAPKDEDLQAAFRLELRKKLKLNETLQIELKILLEKISASTNSNTNSMKISNSKNIIQGSNISVGGNMYIGDQTINEKDSLENSTVKKYFPVSETIKFNELKLSDRQVFKSSKPFRGKEKVKKALGQYKIKDVLELLLKYSSSDNELHNIILMISCRWNGLTQANAKGIINNDQFMICENRLVQDILLVLDDFF